MKIKRNLEQYTEIENFEDYEFTSCVAYELAIRNCKVIELIKRQLKHLKENYNSFNNDISDELFFKYFINEFYLAYHFFSDIININEEKKISGSFWKNKVSKDIKKEEDELTSFEHYNGFSIFTKIYDNSYTPDRREVITNFQRPPLESYHIHTDFDVKINFSLPLKDLEEYIKEIKKSFEEKKVLPKSGFEILNDIELNSGNLITPREILSNKNKVADMLFIYDCKKLNYKVLDIRYKLEDYYSLKGISTKSFTEKTIKNYYDVAKTYIDERKYKELVTGISIDELENIKE